MSMSIVNQSHHLILNFASILTIQNKQKIEDLVTIRNPLFVFIHRPFTYTHSKGSTDPIKKLCFVIS